MATQPSSDPEGSSGSLFPFMDNRINKCWSTRIFTKTLPYHTSQKEKERCNTLYITQITFCRTYFLIFFLKSSYFLIQHQVLIHYKLLQQHQIQYKHSTLITQKWEKGLAINEGTIQVQIYIKNDD